MLNDCKPTGSLPKKGNKQKNMIKKKTNQHRHKQVGKIDVYNFHHVTFVEQRKISVSNMLQANEI